MKHFPFSSAKNVKFSYFCFICLIFNLILACGIPPPNVYWGQREFYNANFYADRGERHFQDENYDLAIEDLTEAIRLEPNNVLCYGIRAIIYNKMENYEAAVEDYNAAIRLRPDIPVFYNGRAWTLAYHLKRDYDRAIADATQAIKIKPKEAGYYDTRGWAYFGKGDCVNAINDFFTALKLNPNIDESKDGLRKCREAQATESTDDFEGL